MLLLTLHHCDSSSLTLLPIRLIIEYSNCNTCCNGVRFGTDLHKSRILPVPKGMFKRQKFEPKLFINQLLISVRYWDEWVMDPFAMEPAELA